MTRWAFGYSVLGGGGCVAGVFGGASARVGTPGAGVGLLWVGGQRVAQRGWG